MLVLNNLNQHTYKTGYLINKANTQIAFRYKVLDREDIQRIDILSGIEGKVIKKIIGTTSNIQFEPTSKIKLDGVIYLVDSIYKEPNDNENGMFVNNLHPKMTYLNLVR